MKNEIVWSNQCDGSNQRGRNLFCQGIVSLVFPITGHFSLANCVICISWVMRVSHALVLMCSHMIYLVCLHHFWRPTNCYNSSLKVIKPMRSNKISISSLCNLIDGGKILIPRAHGGFGEAVHNWHWEIFSFFVSIFRSTEFSKQTTTTVIYAI